MGDINLIPNDYLDRLEKKSLLVKYLSVVAAFNAILLASSFAISGKVDSENQIAAQLRSDHLATELQQNQLQLLMDERESYDREWSLLRGLRAGAAIDDIFSMVDLAVGGGELWFDDWSFRRSSVSVDGRRRGIDSGFLIVVDDNSDKPDSNKLSVETHMNITGHALDHGALSRFVRALFEQSDVQDVRVQKTGKANYANGVAVNFNLVVVLNSNLGDS